MKINCNIHFFFEYTILNKVKYLVILSIILVHYKIESVIIIKRIVQLQQLILMILINKIDNNIYEYMIHILNSSTSAFSKYIGM